jgi:hypothetical protein
VRSRARRGRLPGARWRWSRRSESMEHTASAMQCAWPATHPPPGPGTCLDRVPNVQALRKARSRLFHGDRILGQNGRPPDPGSRSEQEPRWLNKKVVMRPAAAARSSGTRGCDGAVGAELHHSPGRWAARAAGPRTGRNEYYGKCRATSLAPRGLVDSPSPIGIRRPVVPTPLPTPK